MALDVSKNFAIGTLSAGIASGATSVVLVAGQGTRFPTAPFNAVIWNATNYSNAADAFYGSQAEIVRVTAVATDTFTITRAQESTTAQNLNTAGITYRIVADPTALTIGQIATPIADGIDQGYIRGCNLAVGPTSISVQNGEFWDPAAGRVLKRTIGTVITSSSFSPPGLVAGAAYQVYAFFILGTYALSYEVIQEDPPSTTYFGTARRRATGNQGRWIGSAVTDSSGVLMATSVFTRATESNSVEVVFAPASASTNRILSAGVATSFSQILATPVCPRYATTEICAIFSTTYPVTAAASVEVSTSLDAIFTTERLSGYCAAPNALVNHTGWHPVNIDTGLYYKVTSSSPGVNAQTTIDVTGYRFAR